MESIFTDKKILVTGGAGSIGKDIVKELLKHDPDVVRILDNDETKNFELEQELRSHKNIRYLLGDIRDKERMYSAAKNIDIIFHAAALKHVYACEYNPFEAVKTNIIGLHNMIDVAIDENVEKFIFTSSDKAANPSSVMGTTKLLGEKLVTSANYYKGSHDVIFSSVRFGNVMGSRGSVIPLFKKQMENGGPITITNGEMTRFMMSTKEAISLIFKSAEIMKGGEVFVLKMPVFKLSDLVEVMLESRNMRIEKINPKPGERAYEELMTREEAKRALETDDMFIILPMVSELLQRNDYIYPNARKAKIIDYTSDSMPPLSKEEIKDFLKTNNLI